MLKNKKGELGFISLLVLLFVTPNEKIEIIECSIKDKTKVLVLKIKNKIVGG